MHRKNDKQGRRPLIWQLLAAVAGVLAGLIVLRLLFVVLMANPANPVTNVVKQASQPFLFPWSHLWPPQDTPGVIVERAALAALGTYLAAGIALGLVGRCIQSPGTRAGRPRQEEETP